MEHDGTLARDEIKTLAGLLPICARCKKIRENQGYWNQLESSLRDHADLRFSHSVCPECVERLYPEFVARKSRDGGRAERLAEGGAWGRGAV